jgi:tellurite resistance protein
MGYLDKLGGDDPQAALIEAMVLTVSADGVIEKREESLVHRIVLSKKEFGDLTEDRFSDLLNRALSDIKREGISKRADALAKVFTKKADRLNVFELAFEVVLKGGRMGPNEIDTLKRLQSRFGLSEEEVEEIHMHLTESTPVESLLKDYHEEKSIGQFYLEVMLLMAAADGILQASEKRRIMQTIEEHIVFKHVEKSLIEDWIEQSLRDLEREGVIGRITAIAEALEGDNERRTAFGFATDICLADGAADPAELELLKAFQSRFRIEDKDAEVIINAVVDRRSRGE